MSDIPGQITTLGYELGEDPWYEAPDEEMTEEQAQLLAELETRLQQLNAVSELFETEAFEWIVEQFAKERESLASRADKIVEHPRWAYYRGGMAVADWFLAFPDRIALMRGRVMDSIRDLTGEE